MNFKWQKKPFNTIISLKRKIQFSVAWKYLKFPTWRDLG